MNLMETIAAQARKRKPRVLLAEGEEPTIAQAARRCTDEGIAECLLLGDRATIEGLGVDLTGISVIDRAEQQKQAPPLAQWFEEKEDFPAEATQEMLADDLNMACLMCAHGEADAMVAGFNYSSADVYQYAQLFIGLAEGIITPSSYVIVDFPNQDDPVIFGDCTMVVQPSAEELAAIAVNTARSSEQLLGWEPRVALLSFSTTGSAEHPDAQKVRDALSIARAMEPQLLIDGELQLDAAISPRVAAKKVKGDNPLGGKANILIFPDIDAGNIGVKLVQNYAHANIYTAVCGYAKPINDMSRSMGVEDVVGVIAIAAAQA